MPEKTAQKEPGKKPVPSKKPKPQQEVVIQIPLSELHPFPDHPFKVRDDEAMQETAESIRQYGVLVPAIVRPREDGGYEIVAGHRRKHGSELAGLQNLPCIVREMDDDTATILMVDSNIQRENKLVLCAASVALILLLHALPDGIVHPDRVPASFFCFHVQNLLKSE